MKVSDIISAVLSTEKHTELPQAGGAEPADFENSPGESYIDMKTVFSMGDDVHKPKNPADIRTNAPSMYPNFQAKG